MSQNTPEYERWKVKMKIVLDELVATNFERLYHSPISEYTKIWGALSRELHQRFDLVGVTHEDPEYELKRKKQHCIYINIRLYSEKVFPWELMNDRILRFVKQYGKLPKQLPEEWRNFEPEQRLEEIRKQREADKKLDDYLEASVAAHPEYVYR